MNFLNTPAFFLLLTMGIYILFSWIYFKVSNPFLNPVLWSIAFIILFLKVTGFTYEEYMGGGAMISFFLAPATVVLALPLVKNFSLLKKQGVAVVAGIFMGSVTAVVSTLVLCRLLGVDRELLLSLLPKNVTTPIGLELSKTLGGLPAVTVAAIVFTGIAGNILGPLILKLIRIKDPVAQGTALGTSSHAIGTSRAIEIGEVQGAVSGLCIGVAGFLTSLIVPLVLFFS